MQHLTITDFGVFLGKHSERLVVKKGRETVSEHPLLDLEEVTVATKGVSLSTDLIAACAERGIPIYLLSWSGQPYAQINSPALTATVQTRREQLLAYYDERGVEIASRFAGGKVRNQINTVQYFAKYRKKRAPKKYAEIAERVGKMGGILGKIEGLKGREGGRRGREGEAIGEPEGTNEKQGNPGPSSPATCHPSLATIDAVRPALLNLEGRAGALYWECVQRILPEGRFTKREHRAADDVNALLNYGYGILYSQVWSALLRAGLEPFGGFLHVDRPGKPSLVLDFIEEFRQPVVDRVVIASLNKGFPVEWERPDTDAATGAHQSAAPEASPIPQQQRLSSTTRQALAARIHARLAETERYERKQVQLRHILQRQARHLATFLRREGEYKPFVMKW